MAEPATRAPHLETLLPWLLHWSIEDERIEGHRSDAFAVRTPEGLVLIDPLPLAERLETELQEVSHIFLTHGNHQRSAWRLRRELGALVYAPVGDAAFDEQPDVWYDETTPLPGGLEAIRATAFRDACYLVFEHAEGARVLFCGDLICHDPGGPYRFPEQPGYFDPATGPGDARRLLDRSPNVLCAAHAVPSLDGCREALQGAIDRAGGSSDG